jgi:predicted ABC-type ATPase
VADRAIVPCIWVVAGTNGAGKSSIGGAMIRQRGGISFDPDEAARRIRLANPGLSVVDANSAAWSQGKRLLERTIAERLDFVFETTLGGRTITGLLAEAAAEGFEVRIWYVGLQSPELHLARVRARVARGGHDIPEANIRQRFDASRQNLIRLLPKLTALHLYDNSRDGDPHAGREPQPLLLLHVDKGRIVFHADLREIPDWAKPIVAAAIGLHSSIV